MLILLTLAACDTGPEAESLYVAHPDDTSKQVEYFLAKPAGEGPWPTVVLLHGHQGFLGTGGAVFVKWGALERLARHGYLAVAVSQPGYGDSDGPADFCGPFTQHAVSGVIAGLRAQGLASPDKLVVEGISRGALTAGLVAAHDPSVSGVVLISGVYDLVEYVADSKADKAKAGVVRLLTAETGGSDDALRARSLLEFADRIRGPALILNGAQDDLTDADQARRLAGEIVRGGGSARAIIYPGHGHRIPEDVRDKDVDTFIAQVLGNGDPS